MSKENFLKGVALIFRFWEGEIPYINSFLMHYKKLGVVEFIGITRSNNDMNLLKDIFKNNLKLGSSAELKVINKEGFNPTSILRKITMKELNIKEKFVLHLDCDEYLIQNGPQKYQNPISLFLDKNKKDGINFYWAIACSYSLKTSKSFAFKWNVKKQLARTNKIIGFDGPHRFLFIESNRSSNSKIISETQIIDSRLFKIHLAHFMARSMNDALIRILASDLKSRKINSIDSYLKGHELPPRLKGNCYFDLLEGNIRIIDAEPQKNYNFNSEKKILNKYISKNNLKNIKELYLEYYFLLNRFINKNQDFDNKGILSIINFEKMLPKMSELRKSS